MSIDNTVTITGNLTRDPELKYTPGGTALCQLGVACGHRRLNKQTNEWEEEPGFYDVTVWAELAENVAESLGKGNRVTVTGRLQYRQWETPEGQKRNKVDIVADDVAASLRWATVGITRTTREGGYQGDGAPMPEYAPDEEPFHMPAHEWWPGFFGSEWPERILP